MNDRWEDEWDTAHGRSQKMDDMNLTAQPGMIPEDMFEEPVWYSYLHVSNDVCTKRYLSWGDYKEVGDSDRVKYVTRLYTARDRDVARAEGVRLVRAHFA